MQLLQPKMYNLRLNLEQVQHIFDGLIENRKLVGTRHLPLYDSQVQDLQSQMRQQGVQIELGEPDDTMEQDIEDANDMIQLLTTQIHNSSMDPMEKVILHDTIKELRKIIFG